MVLTGGTDRAIRLWNLADSSQCAHIVSPITKSKNIHFSFKSVPGGGGWVGWLGGLVGGLMGRGWVGGGVDGEGVGWVGCRSVVFQCIVLPAPLYIKFYT